MPFITQGKANIKYLLIVALVATVAGGVIFVCWNNCQKEAFNLNNYTEMKKPEKSTEDKVVCTMDAKLCSDGSYVSRTGPNCEFAPCPAEIANWKTYRNEKMGFEVRYPSNYYVLPYVSDHPEVNFPLVLSNNYNMEERETGTLQEGQVIITFYTFNKNFLGISDFIKEWGSSKNQFIKASNEREVSYGHTSKDYQLSEDDVLFSEGQIQLDNTSATYQIIECKKTCMGSEREYISYFFIKNNRFYKIWAQLYKKDQGTESTFSQILSTLKLL